MLRVAPVAVSLCLLAGLRSSYASQHSQLGQELRSAVSPDMHITPIYEGRTFYSPVYRSPTHGTLELQHGSQAALFRSASGGSPAAGSPFLGAAAASEGLRITRSN